MKLLASILYFFLIVLSIASCKSKLDSISKEDLQIAIIADAHLQDVYGKLTDNDYKGIKNKKNGKYSLIRTMDSQLHSTRIFNENYFAFLAALDDIVKRDIKYVLLPGDFSDDGQPLHLRGLKQILDRYSKLYDISFFLITGNHDIVHPFSHDDGKNDFLGAGGKAQPIISNKTLHSLYSNENYPPIITKDIQNLGYLEVSKLLGDFGFFPKATDLYWESPFSTYNYDNYNFKKASELAALEKRSEQLQGNDIPIPDISYLVEPIEGLWLIALDANTYLKNDIKNSVVDSRSEYRNTGQGHNNLLDRKKYLFNWVEKVVKDAEMRGKTLIAFSHYPMIDFNNNATSNIDNLLIDGKMQLSRVPDEEVAQMFAQAGLKIHFGGHMHLNNTGIRTTALGNTLINIQTPSLAAYKPAYKILTLKEKGMAEIETVVIDSVPGFNTFFDLYRQEYDYLESIGAKDIWNDTVLNSKNYDEFTNWHLRELVRLRFLNSEWPSDVKDLLLSISGKELLLLSQIHFSLPIWDIISDIRSRNNSFLDNWKQLDKTLKENGMSIDSFENWSGEDLLFDIYRLRSAGQLAFTDIGTSRLKQYQFLTKAFLRENPTSSNKDNLNFKLIELMHILDKFMRGDPSDHFEINLTSGAIQEL